MSISADTKYKLAHAVTSEDVANEIALRLAVSSAPINAAAAQAILDTLDVSPAMNAAIEERLRNGLAGDNDGAAGQELADKLNGMVVVLQAQADGNEVAAVAASFSGQVAGMTTDVTIGADNAGTAGNSISLAFDGIGDIDAALATWNAANPGNTATLISGNGSQVPGNLETIDLAGGAAAYDANLIPAQAAMGSDHMSDSAEYCLRHALTSESASQDFRDAFDAMIDAIQSI